MECGYSINGQPHYTFGIVVEGERVARLTGEQLAAMGYYYIEHGPCVGVLRYADRERLITCPKPVQLMQTRQSVGEAQRLQSSSPS